MFLCFAITVTLLFRKGEGGFFSSHWGQRSLEDASVNYPSASLEKIAMMSTVVG